MPSWPDVVTRSPAWMSAGAARTRVRSGRSAVARRRPRRRRWTRSNTTASAGVRPTSSCTVRGVRRDRADDAARRRPRAPMTAMSACDAVAVPRSIVTVSDAGRRVAGDDLGRQGGIGQGLLAARARPRARGSGRRAPAAAAAVACEVEDLLAQRGVFAAPRRARRSSRVQTPRIASATPAVSALHARRTRRRRPSRCTGSPLV